MPIGRPLDLPHGILIEGCPVMSKGPVLFSMSHALSKSVRIEVFSVVLWAFMGVVAVSYTHLTLPTSDLV